MRSEGTGEVSMAGVASVVAFDPGRNIGVAWIAPDQAALRLAIVSEGELAGLPVPSDATVLVGDGTGHRRVAAALRLRGFEPRIVDERNTTLEARSLYFRDHPVRGLARLLPVGMRSPERSIDDYAAYAIALRWLARGDGR